jgi:hypothetical protein
MCWVAACSLALRAHGLHWLSCTLCPCSAGPAAAWQGGDACSCPFMRCPCVCVQDGWTPLYIAAAKGHAPCVELLLGKGANVDQADNVGKGLQGVGVQHVEHIGSRRERPRGFLAGGRLAGNSPSASGPPQHHVVLEEDGG